MTGIINGGMCYSSWLFIFSAPVNLIIWCEQKSPDRQYLMCKTFISCVRFHCFLCEHKVNILSYVCHCLPAVVVCFIFCWKGLTDKAASCLCFTINTVGLKAVAHLYCERTTGSIERVINERLTRPSVKFVLKTLNPLYVCGSTKRRNPNVKVRKLFSNMFPRC